MNKKGLGKGLQALLPDIKDNMTNEERVIEVDVDQITVNKHQPRHVFNEEKLNELADSIKEHGVVQPIIVRNTGKGRYELVAGERRWRACKIAGIKKVPAIVKELTEKETSEIALIENIQREDLNPIEEAIAYNTLMEEYGLTQEELSKRVGKSRPFIANTVRLLSLSEPIKELVYKDALSAGHARALMGLPKDKDRQELAKKIVLKGWSVRQVESEVKNLLAGSKKAIKKQENTDPVISDIEERLKNKFCTKVCIRHGGNSGRIELEYYGEEELQRLIEVLLGDIDD